MRLISTLQNIKRLRDEWLLTPEKRFPPDISSGLSNPDKRAEIPAHFPQTVSPYSVTAAIEVMEQQLALRGTSLGKAGRVSLAYPHKHPELFPFMKNAAEERVLDMQRRLRQARPDVDWPIAASICERVHLGRSEDQSSIYAFTAKQVYDVYRPAQKEPLPFIENPLPKTPEYFAVVDWTIEQGTTVANLMSYLRHNGAEVLMVMADRHAPLVQERLSCNDNAVEKVELSAAFNDRSRNTGRLPELAAAFALSARKERQDWAPAECIEKFEAGLNRHGNSVFALTDGECLRLMRTLRGEFVHNTTFPKLIENLAKPARRPQPKRMTDMFN